MSISDKHNYKTFTKSPPASLLHCIENILNHSSKKCSDSDNGYSEFHRYRYVSQFFILYRHVYSKRLRLLGN